MSGNKLINSVVLCNDNNSISVPPPSGGYMPGQTYYLFVYKGLESVNYGSLAKTVKMQFAIGN
jgi:hypothetical protein